jgi:butyrate kinase
MTDIAERILVINPGATSTKIAVYDGEELLFKRSIEHKNEMIREFKKIFDQYKFRLETIYNVLEEEKTDPATLSAVVGRGGLVKPVPGGTFAINSKMLADLEKAERGQHASNLGAVLAYNIAERLRIPSFIVDPVAVDELDPVARICGYPGFEKNCLSHALNVRAVARKAAGGMGRKFTDCNFIVIHLGTGISVNALKKGKMIEACNAKDDGPFSVDRCGALPVTQLIELCYSNQYSKEELLKRIVGEGGIYAYLGTRDIREVEQMEKDGDEKAKVILDAFTYQVARETGAIGAALCGEVDKIVITGGMANSARVVDDIVRRVKFIAEIVLLPGEEELQSLALGALRVLNGDEKAKEYQ